MAGNQMVTRVGGAIASAFAGKLTNNYHPFPSELSPEAAEMLARAAIEAMRKPTESMVRAGEMADGYPFPDMWSDVTDAALKPLPPHRGE